MENKLRYTVFISFKIGRRYTQPIEERVKTLKEARQYKSLIDDTVHQAYVTDNVKGVEAEVWVK